MIFLGNIPVLTSIYQIMITLQRELKMNDSLLLNKVIAPKNKGADIQFCCPFHKNGMESRPSAGITTVEKHRNGKDIPIGTFACFTCKKSGDITELISYCFGKEDGGIYGREWILDHFSNFEIENRKGFFKSFKEEKENKEITYVKEEELEKYRYYHPYMYKRGLTDEIIELFDIGYDKNFYLAPSITFPVRDEKGNIVFIARRAVNTKLFHYPTNVEKPVVYLYEMQKLFPNYSELFICESIFNALTLIKWNKPAIALLGTGSKNQLELLKTASYRKYTTVFDGDEAGENAYLKFYKALSPYKFINKIQMPKGTDVNDLAYLTNYKEFINAIKQKEGI